MNRDYFAHYCGRGSYDDLWRDHSGIEHCLWIRDRMGFEVRSVLVLGAATGRVLERFEEEWALRPWGCEISHWAHARIPGRYRRRIARADMRRLVRDLERRRRHFDLCFTNALVYVPVRELPDLIERLSHLVGYLHFWSSTSEDPERGDRYRVTTRSRRWWRDLFMKGGFAPTRSRYLWRSDTSSR